MPISEVQRAVATIALGAAARNGFALAGGNALIAHGIIDRPTDDVDLFSDQETGVAAAADAVETALREAGFLAERRDLLGDLGDVFEGMGEGLAEWIITAPGGQQTMLQMAYFDRTRGPVTMDVGPVLDLEDLAGWKAVALVSRVEPRDYVDTAAALEHYTVDELITLAKRLDSGLEDRDFADAGRQLDRMPDRVFSRYVHSQQDIARLRERFAGWPRTLPRMCAGPGAPGGGAAPWLTTLLRAWLKEARPWNRRRWILELVQLPGPLAQPRVRGTLPDPGQGPAGPVLTTVRALICRCLR